MDFGHVESLEGVDFALPPADPRSTRLLGETGAFRLCAGAPAWAHREWVGRVYPPGTPQVEWLAAYAKHFDAVELNATHYRVPDAETLAGWRDATPPGFRFFPKFPKDVS